MQIIITDNTVSYEKDDDDTLESIGVNIGDVFDVLDSCNGGWWIKTGRYTIPVTEAEAKYTQRHRIMMLVPTTLREVAVNKFILIASAVYVMHALRGLV